MSHQGLALIPMMEEEVDHQPPETPLAGEVTQGTAFQGLCHEVPFPLSPISAPPCESSPWTVVTQALETLQEDGVPVPAEPSSAQTGSAPHCAVQASVTVTVSTTGTRREIRKETRPLLWLRSAVFYHSRLMNFSFFLARCPPTRPREQG